MTGSFLENQPSCNVSDVHDLNDLHYAIDPDHNFLDKIKQESNYYSDDLLCKTLRKSNGFSIVHFNIGSLNSNFKMLDLYLSQLDVKFDIIAITETWFSESTVPEVFKIKGYELKYVTRNVGRGGEEVHCI